MIDALVRKVQSVESHDPAAALTVFARHISVPESLPIEYAQARICGVEPRHIVVVLRKQPDVFTLCPIEVQHYSTTTTGTKFMPALNHSAVLVIDKRDCNIQVLRGVVANRPMSCMRIAA
jgi:hypothetical protein